jgi:hypothetical protein
MDIMFAFLTKGIADIQFPDDIQASAKIETAQPHKP